MTREERENAIDIIQSILDKYEEDECLAAEITIGDEDIEALKIAIKALEQESCEDAISRQAAIDTLLTERKKLDSCMQKCLENNQMSLRALNKAERNRIEEDIYIIKNLPPVTPTQI